MHFLHLARSALLLPLITAQVDFDSTPECPKGVQVITAAGTGQKDKNDGYGTIDGLTQDMLDSIEGSSSVALQYPADLNPYEGSVQQGIVNMTAYIRHFVDACPNIQLVLLGYSQGAQVSLSTICGWPDDRYNFYPTDRLEQRYRDNILAVLSYGDPTHTVPTAFDKGNSSHDGIFPRLTGECNFFRNKIASWCDHGDEFCDACPPPANSHVPNPRGCSKDVHASYWDIYNGDAVHWLGQKYKQANPQSPTPNPPTSTSSSGQPYATISTGSEDGSQPSETSSAATRLQPWFIPSFNLLRAQHQKRL